MSKPGTPPHDVSPVRQPVLLGLFAGTAVGAGYLLSGVPNVELMTLITALAGAALGAGPGFVCGALAAAVFSLGSPYGAPVPLLLVAQALGMGSAGVAGRLVVRPLLAALARGSRRRVLALAAAAGLLPTLVHELLTNLAIVGAFDLTPAVVFVGAVPFLLIHVGVNTAVFALLLPVLLPRVAHLARSPLAGGPAQGLLLLVCCLGLAAPAARAQEPEAATAAPADTLAPAAPEPAGPLGWRRPLWEPFAATGVQWLDRHTSWIPVSDGGLGAATVILGEAGTSPVPRFVRDGLPLGTGHALADDPWLVPIQSQRLLTRGWAGDRWGGSGGRVELVAVDDEPARAVTNFQGVKGPHQSYQRGISLVTPSSDWRLRFEFEESLDNEAWNYSDLPDEEFNALGLFPGHARVRQHRLRLQRALDYGADFSLQFSGGRKTRDGVPAWNAGHQELWDSGVAVAATGRSGPWDWSTALFWNNRDVEWGPRPGAGLREARKVETALQGLALRLDRGALALEANLSDWEVDDTGFDWSRAPTATPRPGDDNGQTAVLAASGALPAGPLRAALRLEQTVASHGGGTPGGSLTLAAPGAEPWLTAELSRSGRTPRSDELLTPVERSINGRTLLLLPDRDLEAERTWRTGLRLQKRLLGTVLAVDGSWRRLERGIFWQPLTGETDIGRWRNGLELDSVRLTASLSRQGRFAGWGRALLEGTWQEFDEIAGTAPFLPPRRYLRLDLRWEHHYFQEDGILQLALLSTAQGAMNDPWDVTRTAVLPARTLHDLLVGFRLVGAHLTLAIRNLTDQKIPLSAGARANGREMEMRLNWTFLY